MFSALTGRPSVFHLLVGGGPRLIGGSVVTFLGTRVRRTTDQTISNNTVTAVSFDTADVNTLGAWVVGSPTRLTIPTSGIYAFGGCATFALSGSGSTRSCRVNLNGAGTLLAADTQPGNAGTRSYLTPSPGIYNFTAGDYIELEVFQDSGGNLAAQASGATTTVFWLLSVS